MRGPSCQGHQGVAVIYMKPHLSNGHLEGSCKHQCPSVDQIDQLLAEHSRGSWSKRCFGMTPGTWFFRCIMVYLSHVLRFPGHQSKSVLTSPNSCIYIYILYINSKDSQTGESVDRDVHGCLPPAFLWPVARFLCELPDCPKPWKNWPHLSGHCQHQIGIVTRQ